MQLNIIPYHWVEYVGTLTGDFLYRWRCEASVETRLKILHNFITGNVAQVLILLNFISTARTRCALRRHLRTKCSSNVFSEACQRITHLLRNDLYGGFWNLLTYSSVVSCISWSSRWQICTTRMQIPPMSSSALIQYIFPAVVFASGMSYTNIVQHLEDAVNLSWITLKRDCDKHQKRGCGYTTPFKTWRSADTVLLCSLHWLCTKRFISYSIADPPVACTFCLSGTGT